jgi:predicted ATPase/class 3 adenylate cyclase
MVFDGPVGGFRYNKLLMELPTGAVTFLFTDIAGSTQLWEEKPEAMRAALPRHDALADEVASANRGKVVRSRGEGDSLFMVFSEAPNAVVAAAELQRALLTEPWPDGIRLRARMAIHTGEADLRAGDYYGSDVNRAARLRALAHPEQILVSHTTHDLARESAPPACGFRALGEHRLKDLDRPEAVFQLLHPDLPDDFPDLKPSADLAGNLPPSLTSFIGRQQEIEEVKRRLEKSRLVTLTGSGGCGKTRLALHVASHLRPRFVDGAWFVDLSVVVDPALVADVVRDAFGFPDPGDDDIGALVDGLRTRSSMLVLDGCEHLIEACGRLCERLLLTCPGLAILATSRQSMGVAGERTYRIPSLSLPDDGTPPTATSVRDCEAVQLFVERARAHRADFKVNDRNAPHLAAICRRLDGIPLAIELAAARTRSLSIEELSARLDERFHLLVGGNASAIPRQQTLEALIDWSYTLLTPSEKKLLSRLSVFSGGWTLAAAEAICAGDAADPVGHAQVLNLLTSLVDKSLVSAESNDERTRYGLLESVREFARDRLDLAGETLAIRRRHREYYLKYGFREGVGLFGDLRTGMRRFREEQGNLRRALTTLVEDSEGVEGGLRVVPSLVNLWSAQARLKEGGRMISGLLSRVSPETDSALVGQARHALKRLLGRDPDRHPEREHEGGPTDRPALEEPTHRELPRTALPCIPGRPTDRLREAQRTAHEVGDGLKAALCAYYLADASLRKGDLSAARAGFEEAAEEFRAVGDDTWLAAAAERLGEVARREGAAASAE